MFKSVISLVLIFAAFGLANAANNFPGLKPTPARPAPICYTVHIDNVNHFTGAGENFMIMITDESNNMVAEPQRFRAGEWYYNFYEQGYVQGTRIAQLVKTPYGPGSYAIPPCVRTGIFQGNTCYLFNIAPYKFSVPTGKKEQ